MCADRAIRLCICKVIAKNERQKERDIKECWTVCVALYLKRGSEKILGEEVGGVG